MAGSEHDRDVLAGAALEGLAVQRAWKRDGDAIALLRALGLGGERPVLLGERLQRLVDLIVGDRRGQPFELDGLEIGERDRRHDLHLDRVGEVGFAVDDALDGAFVRRQHHFGLGGELKAVIGDDLAVGLADRGFDHLRHGGLAVEALEMGDRHLAGPETAQLHAAFEIVEPLVDLRLEIGRRNDDAVFPLETRGGSFSHLHRHYSSRPEYSSRPQYRAHPAKFLRPSF